MKEKKKMEHKRKLELKGWKRERQVGPTHSLRLVTCREEEEKEASAPKACQPGS